MAQTDIPYCDATWDLTIGCRKRSPGCAHCWATHSVHRLSRAGADGYCTHHDRDRTDRELRCAVIQTASDGKDWLSTPSVNLLHWNLELPIRWRAPRFIFVNSKSDLFDERVPFEYIGDIFDVMNEARQHHYMLLTKEPDRLAGFITWYQNTQFRKRRRYPVIGGPEWPRTFPHVILMTSIEDADHLARWSDLRRIPATHRGISFEPLIGPVANYLPRLFAAGPRPDWVVIGCEKLLGGRMGRWHNPVPSPEAWWAEAGAILRHCYDGGVRCWMKQGPTLTGSSKPFSRVTGDPGDFSKPFGIQEPPPW